jgi:hypothetical protein
MVQMNNNYDAVIDWKSIVVMYQKSGIFMNEKSGVAKD